MVSGEAFENVLEWLFFVKIENAYEILKDDATREKYDYAIAHPKDVFDDTPRYYQD